jgi:branched-chain amino acid transport system permease protein
VFYLLAFVLCVGAIIVIRRVLFAPFGYALRASRDSPLRCDAIGIDVQRVQWIAFIIAGTLAGLAGGLFAFSKGSIAPDSTLSVSRSIEALVMVLLGGVQTLIGPVVGAATYTWLQDTIARSTDYWRAALGITILGIVLAFPQGIVGALRARFEARENPA